MYVLRKCPVIPLFFLWTYSSFTPSAHIHPLKFFIITRNHLFADDFLIIYGCLSLYTQLAPEGNDSQAITPIPLTELAPTPSMDDLFGNIDQLKKQHEENVSTFYQHNINREHFGTIQHRCLYSHGGQCGAGLARTNNFSQHSEWNTLCCPAQISPRLHFSNDGTKSKHE